jgi:hypothetical protein
MAYSRSQGDSIPEPTGPTATNPLFAQPDAVVRGTKAMVAKRLLSKASTEWAFCETHKCVVFCRPDGFYEDWAGGLHANVGGNVSFKYPPYQPCYIRTIPPESIVNISDDIGRVSERMTELRKAMQESGMVPHGGSTQEIVEDYRRPNRTVGMKVKRTDVQRFDTSNRLVTRPVVEITPIMGTVHTFVEDAGYTPKVRKRNGERDVTEDSRHVQIEEDA